MEGVGVLETCQVSLIPLLSSKEFSKMAEVKGSSSSF